MGSRPRETEASLEVHSGAALPAFRSYVAEQVALRLQAHSVICRWATNHANTSRWSELKGAESAPQVLICVTCYLPSPREPTKNSRRHKGSGAGGIRVAEAANTRACLFL